MSATEETQIKGKNKLKTQLPLTVDGAVLYADAGVKPNPGFGGWGVHGYLYSEALPKKGSGNPTAIPTNNGYVMKAEYAKIKAGGSSKTKDAERDDEPTTTQLMEITPISYIDGFGSVPNISNNAGEVIAAQQALRIAGDMDVKKITLFTDSKYVVKGATEYLDRWVNNNWIKSDGQQVSNMEHWQAMHDCLNVLKDKGISYDIQWIRGHNGHLGNTIVDKYATMGRRLSAENINKANVSKAPAEGYWSEQHERHPFIHHPCSYLTTAMAGQITGEYFLGFHGKEDDAVGKREADGAYAYVILKELDPLIELVKKRTNELATRDDALVMCHLNKLYERDTINRLMRFGQDCFYRPDTKRLHLSISEEDVKEEPITSELYPPRIAYRAIESLNMLKGLLLDWLNNKDTELISTDITDQLFEVDEKGKNRLKPAFAVGFTSLPTMASFGKPGDVKEIPLTLTVGMDLPERNALKRLESLKPNIKIITWYESPLAIRYACIVEANGDHGIWAGYYSNLKYLK